MSAPYCVTLAMLVTASFAPVRGEMPGRAAPSCKDIVAPLATVNCNEDGAKGNSNTLSTTHAVGCLVLRRYGSTVSKAPKRLIASSLDTAAVMITSSPCFQLAGVAT